MKYFCFDTALNGDYTLVKLMQKYPRHISLFAGTDDANIWDAAPWLFELNNNIYELKEDPLVHLAYCIVFETAEPVSNVLSYLQSKIYVRENGQDRFFRIWDARVLMKHLSAGGTIELQDFFSVFDAVYTEAEDASFLNKWTWVGGNRLKSLEVPKPEALPVIKTEEDLNREYDEMIRPGTFEKQEVPAAKEKVVASENPVAEKPKQRKFLID
jgi:hypothetical protein